MSKVKFENSKIIIDGKETQIVSGAIHYFRVHPGYWRDRLEKMVMCGFNCLETYMCWNLHEPEEGKFDFSGGLDFVEFIRIAQELGLYVVLRPGPYICAEWDNGGIPYWVLNKPGVIIRRMNEPYLKCVRNFFDKILPMIKPLQYDEGGPIIALQIENEFGSFNRDLPYIAAVKEMFLAAGMTVPLFTADGASDWCLLNGTLPGTQTLVTGGAVSSKGSKCRRNIVPTAFPSTWNSGMAGSTAGWAPIPIITRVLPPVFPANWMTFSPSADTSISICSTAGPISVSRRARTRTDPGRNTRPTPPVMIMMRPSMNTAIPPINSSPFRR